MLTFGRVEKNIPQRSPSADGPVKIGDVGYVESSWALIHMDMEKCFVPARDNDILKRQDYSHLEKL